MDAQCLLRTSANIISHIHVQISNMISVNMVKIFNFSRTCYVPGFRLENKRFKTLE